MKVYNGELLNIATMTVKFNNRIATLKS